MLAHRLYGEKGNEMIEIYKNEVKRAIEKMIDAREAIYKIKRSFKSVTKENGRETDFDNLDYSIFHIMNAIYFAENVL